jgi:histidyl-tRNA synthetase
MLRTFLNALGLTKLTVELNSLGCHDCRPAYRQALVDYYTSKDRENFCEDCRRRMDTNPLRVLDCKVPACKALVADAPVITDHLCPECETLFADVRAILDGAGVAYELNPRLVRGLDYYVRTCFEVASYDIGSQTAVAGGGRYDGLIKTLGGPDCPASGFACGMERLALLLEQLEAPAPDFYLAVVDASASNQAMLFAQRLRDKGLCGEVSFGSGSMKSRMRAANKSGAKVCLIMGGDELAASTVTVKPMTGDGEQETVSQADYLARIEVQE